MTQGLEGLGRGTRAFPFIKNDSHLEDSGVFSYLLNHHSVCMTKPSVLLILEFRLEGCSSINNHLFGENNC